MPVFKISGFGDDVVEARGGEFQPYDGPIPPKGTILVGLIKQFQLTRNKGGDLMLKCLFEAKGNEADKAKYDGLPVWWNGNVTEQGKGFVNDFLAMLAARNGADPKTVIRAFWQKGPAIEDAQGKLPSPIKGLGTFRINPNGMKGKISTKVGEYKGDEKAEVGFWIMPKPGEEMGPVVDDSGEAGEADDAEVIDDTDDVVVDGEFTDEPPF
jgi:hypothetical protein